MLPLPDFKRTEVPWQAQNLLLTTLSGVVTPLPFAQYNWPLPELAKAQRQSFLFRPDPDIPTPFAQLQWPLPFYQPVISTGWTQNLLETTFSIVAVPIPSQKTEWPLPPYNPVISTGWVQNLLESTLGLPVVVPVTGAGGGGSTQYFPTRHAKPPKKAVRLKHKEEEKALLYVEESVPEVVQPDIQIPKSALNAEKLQLKGLENANQIQIASIEIARNFIEEKKNDILEDELAIIIGIAIAEDDT